MCQKQEGPGKNLTLCGICITLWWETVRRGPQLPLHLEQLAQNSVRTSLVKTRKFNIYNSLMCFLDLLKTQH
jgi:hypothetical protein